MLNLEMRSAVPIESRTARPVMQTMESNGEGIKTVSPRPDAPLVNGEVREQRVLAKFNGILQEARNRGVTIPEDVIRESYGRLNRIVHAGTRLFPEEIAEFNQQGGEVNSAFLVHTRLYDQGDIDLDDPGRSVPAISQKYNVPVEMVNDLLKELGPYEVGREFGSLPDGTKYHVSVIAAQITPHDLYSRKGTDRIRFARPIIEDTINLAEKVMGGSTTSDGKRKNIGLGETLASLTRHGREMQKKYPEFKFVTGHNVTTATLVSNLEEDAEARGHAITDETIGLIGADGSICTAVTEALISKGVGGLILHDTPDKRASLEKKVTDWLAAYPEYKGSIEIVTGNQELRRVINDSDEVVSAAAVEKPIVTREMIGDKDVTFLDDGQPPNIERPLPGRSKYKVNVPLVVLPDHRNSFSTGQPDQASDYTCVAETIMALMPTASDLETIGPVTPGRTLQAQALMKQAGYHVYNPYVKKTPALSLAA